MSIQFARRLRHSLSFFSGWHTNKKIIVFQSDDWGSIRMPSKEVYEIFLQQNTSLDKCHYNRYDSLASEEDLELLFKTLASFSDNNGNHPVFTANTIVANPDFEKIRNSSFSEYYYEVFTDTLKKYPNHGNSFNLWKEGIRSGVFHPQLHGREHLNISRWLDALNRNTPVTRLSFDNHFFGISKDISGEKTINYMPAFDADHEDDYKNHGQILKDAAKIFETLFGFQSKSFIAPSYTWSREMERYFTATGIEYIQTNAYQKVPDLSGGYKYSLHYTGEKNIFGQIYLVRNAYFEPSSKEHVDPVKDCIDRIRLAFRFHKPAIIGTHRVNYIGFINKENRENNLILLRKLLNEIKRNWPEAVFCSTEELGKIIKNESSDIQKSGYNRR